MGILGRSADPAKELAAAERDLDRHMPDLNQAGVELLGAKHDRDRLYAAGATDEEIDAADRRIVLADRRAHRVEIKRAQLEERLKAARHNLRLVREQEARAAAVKAGAAHAEAARKAAATGAEYLQAKFEAANARYVLPTGDLPEMPPMVIDFSNTQGAYARANPVHPSVEQFAFLIANLARELAA